MLERAWVQVAREAVGPKGRVVPQWWLANTTAPGVAADDRRRLDLVIYGASPRGEALCCDATLVSPLQRDGSRLAGRRSDGVALAAARRRKLVYRELNRGGAQRLCVLATDVGGICGARIASPSCAGSSGWCATRSPRSRRARLRELVVGPPCSGRAARRLQRRSGKVDDACPEVPVPLTDVLAQARGPAQ